MSETKSLCWSLLGNICIWPWNTTSEIWNITITIIPEKAQTGLLFNTKSITRTVFLYEAPWGKILSSRGSWLSVCLCQHLWCKCLQTHHILHGKPSHGRVVDSAEQQQKTLRGQSNGAAAIHEVNKQSSSDWPGNWLCLSEWSPRGRQTQTAFQWKLNKMAGNN